MTSDLRKTICISVNAFTSNESQAARITEVLGRSMSGLALDGISCSMSLTRIDEEDLD